MNSNVKVNEISEVEKVEHFRKCEEFTQRIAREEWAHKKTLLQYYRLPWYIRMVTPTPRWGDTDEQLRADMDKYSHDWEERLYGEQTQ